MGVKTQQSSLALSTGGPSVSITVITLQMCLQVKGQKKDQKNQKVKAKVDKQEVEIRQRMTVASLAEAMNKDFGKKDTREFHFRCQ